MASSGPSPAGAPQVSVVVVATNELHHLRDCLPALAAQTHPSFEVIVVDNGSADGGPEYVEAQFPSFRVVRNGANLGYLRANNRGFAAARGQILVVLNPDTAPEPAWLAELVAPLERDPSVGLATSRIMLYDRRGTINAAGNTIHITGLAFCRGLGEPDGRYECEEPVAAISGCAFAVRRAVLEEIGPFDEELNPYLEDTDLSWRAGIAGHRMVYAPRSVVYHKYGLRMRPQKFAYLEGNRLIVLVKSLRWGTLAALFPALLLTEAMTWTFALLRGRAYVKAKIESYALLVLHLPSVLRRRARVQRLRRVSDSQLLRSLTPHVPVDQVLGEGVVPRLLGAVANVVFVGAFWFARMVVRP